MNGTPIYKSLFCIRHFPVRRTLVTCLVGALGWVGPAETYARQPSQRDDPAKKDERSKLGERLIRDTATGAVEDVMDELIRLMDRSARNLDVAFDAGSETQTVQRTIMERLDDAIRAAAAQRRPSRSRSQSADGDKRKRSGKRKSARKSAATEGNGERGASDSKEGSQTGAATEANSPGGDLEQRRRAWGHLPMRERDEILQGLSDRYLERYRVWIERYYKALQEAKD
ncbi:MAG: hypothetical protein IID33_06600 [Planctomycetes bacterium]|nr:hypothetical protein [Planctomycetota bacterium]